MRQGRSARPFGSAPQVAAPGVAFAFVATRGERRRAVGVGAKRGATSVAGRLVELSEPEWSDEGEFVELRLASREFLAPWEATIDGEDPFGAQRFHRFMQRGPSRRRFLIRRRDDGRLAGAISLSAIDRERGSAIVGYWIGAPHARQGLMGEALALVLEFARVELGLRRVEAYVLPENAASIALLERSAFGFEELAPRFRFVAGAMRDHERWVWRAPICEGYLPQSRR